MNIQINPEEKCVKLTEAVFNKYMKHLVQNKYKDFKTWQRKFKVTKKWSYWTSFETPNPKDFI